MTLFFLGKLAAICLGVWAFSAVLSASAERRFPPTGRHVSVDGVWVHLREAGPADAPTVVFVHGASANLLELWAPLAEPLSDEARVVALDRPGLGHSERRAGDHRLGVQARRLLGALDQAGVERAVLVGHSFGSAVVLRMAIERPDFVQGVVLLAPATHPFDGGVAPHNRLAALPVIGPAFARLVPILAPFVAPGGVEKVFRPNTPPDDYVRDYGLDLALRPASFRANALDIANASEEFAAQAPDYATIAAPIVIVSPSDDHVVGPQIHALPLSRQAPDAELIKLPGVGHMPQHAAQDVCLSAIRRLLQRTRLGAQAEAG